MRNLFYIALGIVGATSADAAMQPPSAAQEKPAVIAATQRSASDLSQTAGIAAVAPASCQLQQQPAGATLRSAKDPIVVASAPPRRPPRRTRRR